ncbi:MAG TPA: hypothetical protein VGJ66_26600 [Pyrinomonadaceae bacterium]|jgi:hypothetical protein
MKRRANGCAFLAVDGAMTKKHERQKKGICLDCHVLQKARDFVYNAPPVGA